MASYMQVMSSKMIYWHIWTSILSVSDVNNDILAKTFEKQDTGWFLNESRADRATVVLCEKSSDMVFDSVILKTVII